MVLYGVITTAVISTILNRHKKKETIGKICISYFTAQITFLFLHLITHNSFIDNNMVSGMRVAYCHHYIQ